MALIGVGLAIGSVEAEASPTSKTMQAAPVVPAPLWTAYRDRFISADGRVVDDANKNISHSEGQGYGLLLAGAAGDRKTFATIWGWTEKALFQRKDGLASWRWSPDADPHLTDTNNATDGDILIAWALAEAAVRWKKPAYKVAARRIALAIGKVTTIETRYGLTLMPAASGFGATDMADGPVVNPSYWVFPAFTRLKAVAPEVDWAAITASGHAILQASRFGPQHLPTDWVSLKADAAPAAGFKPEFGYNALRIPLYLAWAGADPKFLSPFAEAWKNLPEGRPAVVDVGSGKAVEPFYDPGYAAVPTLTLCAVGGGGSLAASVPLDHYYSATLFLLARIAARERGLSCG